MTTLYLNQSDAFSLFSFLPGRQSADPYASHYMMLREYIFIRLQSHNHQTSVVSGDMERVIDAIEAIMHYAVTHKDSLLELDVNPLCVLVDGAVAVDVSIRKRSSAN